MSGLDGARKFAEACVLAYPTDSEQRLFAAAFLNLAGADMRPRMDFMYALLTCDEISFSVDETNLIPPGGDPDGPATLQGGSFTWKFRRLTITLYSDGVWLADEDAEDQS